MPQYWWVNHKQTVRQEIDGQYLWSPKVTSRGARNEFYLNMRRASPGDFVLSYADREIRYIGRVADFAFTAPKPSEFGSAGANWSGTGWLLPVYWVELDHPVRPADIIRVLGPLLPEMYSPIDPTTSHGRQGAYLASISEAVFDSVVGSASFDAIALNRGGANSLTFENVVDQLEDAAQRHVEADLTLDDTTRRSVVLARRGQGVFRKNVEAVSNSCRLTGISNPALLIASHIKPWRDCETAAERLDGMNGFMLTPDADLLFGRGFITFGDDGGVLVSRRVDRTDLRRLGFDHLAWDRVEERIGVHEWNPAAFTDRQMNYLDHHRRNVFVFDA